MIIGLSIGSLPYPTLAEKSYGATTTESYQESDAAANYSISKEVYKNVELSKDMFLENIYAQQEKAQKSALSLLPGETKNTKSNPTLELLNRLFTPEDIEPSKDDAAISKGGDPDSTLYGGASNYKEVKKNVLKSRNQREELLSQGKSVWGKVSWLKPDGSISISEQVYSDQSILVEPSSIDINHEINKETGDIDNLEDENNSNTIEVQGGENDSQISTTGLQESKTEKKEDISNTGDSDKNASNKTIVDNVKPNISSDDEVNSNVEDQASLANNTNTEVSHDNGPEAQQSTRNEEAPDKTGQDQNNDILSSTIVNSDTTSLKDTNEDAPTIQSNESNTGKDSIRDNSSQNEIESIKTTGSKDNAESSVDKSSETMISTNIDTGTSKDDGEKQVNLTINQSSGTDTIRAATVSSSPEYNYNNVTAPAAYNNLNVPQYSLLNNNEEIISPKTGDLILKTTDLHLPGRNGLDLDISRIFESNQALSGDRMAEGDNGSFTDYSTYYMDRYGIGSGWTWGFPFVELRGYDSDQKLYYHDGMGAAYKVNFSGSTNGTNLENYAQGDILFQQDSGGYSNGTDTSSYVLIRSDRTKEYFSADGRLLGLKDRFGNNIKFEYSRIPTDIRTPNYHFVFSEDADIWTKLDPGSRVCFSYDNTKGVSFGNHSFKYVAPVSCKYATSYSKLVPINPNTRYYLHGYINNMLTTGDAGLGYIEYDENGNITGNSQVTYVPKGGTNDWYGVEYQIQTSTNARYMCLAFDQYGYGSNISGQSFVDAVRFSLMPNVFSKITDSIGREVTFAYTGIGLDYDDSVPGGGITLTVKDPSKTKNYTVSYVRERYRYADQLIRNSKIWYEWKTSYKLVCVVNGDMNTTYTYTPKDERFSFAFWKPYSSEYYGTLKQLKLTEVRYKSSDATYDYKVNYTYEQTMKRLGASSSFYELARVAGRNEQTNGSPDTNYHRTYSYVGSSTGGFPRYDETGYCNIMPWEDLSKDPNYQFTMTMAQDNGLQVSQASKGGIDYFTTRTNSAGESETTTYEQYDGTFPKLPKKIKLEQTNAQGTNTLYKGYTYNSYGLPASETRLLTYSQWNNSTTKAQNTITYAYDDTFKFLKSKQYYQSAGKQLTESSNYDSNGRLTSTNNAKGETTIYSYGDPSHSGNITAVFIDLLDGKTSQTTYGYTDNAKVFPNTITQSYTENGTVKTSSTGKQYEYLWGNIITETDASNNATSYQYDNQGRVISITYPASTGSSGTYILKDTYAYTYTNLDGIAVYKVQNDRYKDSELIFSAARYYDSHGNLVKSAKWDFDRNQWIEIKNTYNNYGQQNTITDANNNQTSYTYDEWDRLKTIQDAQGNQQQYQYDIRNRSNSSYYLPSGGNRENDYQETYDQWGQVISKKGYPEGNGNSAIEEQYEYDLVGNCTKIIDAKGNQTQFQYDELNRLTKVTNALGEQTDYDYHRLGGLQNIKQYQDSKTFTTTKGYDERGLQISKQDPLGTIYAYQYNRIGKLEQVVDPMGKTTTNIYYADGKLAHTNTGSSAIDRYYSPLGGVEKYTVTGEGEGIDCQFYSTGQVKNKTAANSTTNFQYDLMGNLIQMTDPFGLVSYYEYDSLNRPHTIAAGGKVFEYEYYADGMIKAVNYPGNILRTEYTYDNMNRLKTLVNKKGSEVITSFSYNYDSSGNITTVSENGQTTTYEYDALNRLIGITKPSGEVITYQYDSRGNPVKATGVNIDSLNIIPGTIAYNDWDEVKSFTTEGDTYTYTYDARGLRTTKNGPEGTTRYHCDEAGRVIAEADGNNQVIAEVIWGHKPLARKVGSNYYYYIYNGHGDVIGLTDETGAIVNSYSYDEWGKITSKTETISNPIRYSGEYYDEESGLYYLRARYYDPSIGRFISKDSYEGDIKNPLTINLYAYCGNNPIIRDDPSGHKWVYDGNQWNYLYNMASYDSDEGNRQWAQDQLDRELYYTKWEDDTAWEQVKQIPSTVATSCSDTWNNDVPQTVKYLKSDEAIDAYVNTVVAVAGGRAFREARVLRAGLEAAPAATAATNPLANIKYTDKVKAQATMNDYHGFPEAVDSFGADGVVTRFRGGDGLFRTKIEIPGGYKSQEGVFQYIIEPNGTTCNHRLFVPR